MRPQTLLRITETLRSFPEIPMPAIHAVVAALSTTNKEVRTDSKWKAALAALAADRRSIAQNMGKRTEDMIPLYTDYLAILDAVREKMRIAAMHGTPSEAHAAARKANEARALAGKEPNGTCTTYWPTWVPPRVRDDFNTRLAAHYARAHARKGTRFTPFMTATHRKYTKQVMDNTLAIIKRIRSTHASVEGGTSGYTPYRALYLCAARMAEKALYIRIKGYELGTHNTIDHPLPVNWLALLDAPMRERLRQAQENPHAVTLDGLDHFYEPPRGVTSLDEMPELTDMDVSHAQSEKERYKSEDSLGLEGLTDSEGVEDGLKN
jgi:hypothetical protein